MSTSKRFRAPLIVMFGVLTAVALAGPASAADPVYPPAAGIQVLGVTATAGAPAAAPAAAPVSTGLAFTGTNAIGAGALGGLLLVGGATMVVAGKRRKVTD